MMSILNFAPGMPMYDMTINAVDCVLALPTGWFKRLDRIRHISVCECSISNSCKATIFAERMQNHPQSGTIDLQDGPGNNAGGKSERRAGMKKLSHSQYGALVKKAQQGDAQAFATLYAATVESQLYFATTFLKDASLAEDAVQEVYISLYKNLEKIANGSLFIAYLRRICYNTCVDFRKKQMKNKYELDEVVLDLQADDDIESSPHDRFAAMEQTSELYRALATLPDDQRAVFLMRYYDKMKIGEIAMAMSISESTVKRYVKQAAEKLREKLTAASFA